MASVGAFVGISYLMFKNFQKTTSNLEKFKQRMTNDEIVNSFDQSEILGNCQTVEEGFFRLSLNSEGGGPEVD